MKIHSVVFESSYADTQTWHC